MKKDGIETYEIMQIIPAYLKKYNASKNLLFLVKFPICLGIPLYFEFFDAFLHKEAVSPTYIFLQTFDFLLGINCFMTYSFLKKMVISIHYLPKIDQLEVTRLCHWNLSPKSTKMECS